MQLAQSRGTTFVQGRTTSDRRRTTPSATAVGQARGMATTALFKEFESLVPRSATVVSTWARRHPALAECADLPAVMRAIREDPDKALGALLHEMIHGCPLAPRIVLHAMLPKMISMARRDPAASLEDYLAHLWLRITTYPLDRRPQRIAANLALDTLKAVKADMAPALVPVADLDDDPARHPADDLSARRLLRAAVELRLIDPTTHATMMEVYADGLPEAEVAARHNITATTVRRRCHRGIRVLTAHARRLAEAA